MTRALLLVALAAFAMAPATASQFAWRNIGPAVSGGRVAAVAGTDGDALVYYFGSAGGGVYKTINGGLTWDDVWKGPSVGAIGAVSIAASNKNVVWVGTGEPNPRNDASYGDGVWTTHDGGRHWDARGLANSYAISRIVIDPRDPQRVLAGALGDPFADSQTRGVYRTTNNGKTWQRTLYVGPSSGISDLAMDSKNSNVVFAGVWQFRRVPWNFSSGGPLDGIYKSIDGGQHWRRLSAHGLPTGIMGRIGLAVAPSNSARVYALIQSKQGLLWRSDDAGRHWKMMSADTLIDQRPFYMSRLEVDPADQNHVIFSSENLIETRDGGKTFRGISTAVHQDHHGSWISRNGRRMIEANDGGAPISVDGGKTWDWRFNVVLSQIYHVGYDDQNPYHVCAAIQDNDSFCGPSLSLSPLGITERDWQDVANNADGVWVWPEPGNPSAVWNVGINQLNGQLGIYNLNSRQNYDISPDVTDTNGSDLAGHPYRFNWEAPIAFSRKLPGAAYFGGNVLFETRDRGRSWRVISPDLTRNDPNKQQVAGGPINTDVSGAEFYDALLDIAPSSIDPKIIWVGTDDGVIQRTADGGVHWSEVTPAQVQPWGRVNAVEASSFDAKTAYAVIDRHFLGDRQPYVLVTADAGAHWRSIANGLPANEYAHVVREDPVNPDVLYAGLEQGVWYSPDRGRHWRSLRLNMPPVSIHDLRIHPRTHDLIAGTHGRGLWILDDVTSFSQLAAAQHADGPALFPIAPATAWYYYWEGQYGTHDTGCCVPAGVFSGPDNSYGASISFYLPSIAPAKPWVEVVDARGAHVKRFDVSNHAGLNRAYWDLSEEAPVRWKTAREWNRGPTAGAPVVPGWFTVRLHVGGRTLERPVMVNPDPRESWTEQQYLARHDFLKTLNDELSQIDEALNSLDEFGKHESGATRAKLKAVYSDFTSNPRNSEDNLWAADKLRERVMNLQGVVTLSQGPPLPPHLAESAAIRKELERVLPTFRQFLSVIKGG